MESSSEAPLTITISLPATTPQSVLTYLEQLKELGDRTYAKKITQLFIESIHQSMTMDTPAVIIPLPAHLTQEQQDWFHHPFTKQLMMNWISQLTQPNQQKKLEQSVPSDNVKSDSFQISSSYHNKLVGFFLDDD